MSEKPPRDPAEHAEQFAREWRDKLEEYCSVPMQELGIPDNMNGQPDYDGDGKWHAFDPAGRTGGSNTTGVVIDSGVLNPEVLRGEKGARLWPRIRLRDRIDAIIPHEYEELRLGAHAGALKAAAKTKLPISKQARRLCRARAR
jgi:hypothetical protein